MKRLLRFQVVSPLAWDETMQIPQENLCPTLKTSPTESTNMKVPLGGSTSLGQLDQATGKRLKREEKARA